MEGVWAGLSGAFYNLGAVQLHVHLVGERKTVQPVDLDQQPVDALSLLPQLALSEVMHHQHLVHDHGAPRQQLGGGDPRRRHRQHPGRLLLLLVL